jgi:hypothetical protein
MAPETAMPVPIDVIERIAVVIMIRRPVIIAGAVSGIETAPVPPRGIPGIGPAPEISPPGMRMERMPSVGIPPPGGRRPERIEIIAVKPGIIKIVMPVIILVLVFVFILVQVFLDSFGIITLFIVCVFFGFNGGLLGNHDHGITSHACEHDDADHAGQHRDFHGFHLFFLSEW